MNDLRYPIDSFRKPETTSREERLDRIRRVSEQPDNMRLAVQGLSEEQLDTPYRDGGWTVRQVVHHLADAGMNCFIRTKLGLTEDNPTIKPFDEEGWAELPDAKAAPIGQSLALLEALHKRWTDLFRSLSEADFTKTYNHPVNGVWSLDTALAFFAWHGEHHTAHITELRKRMGWN